MSIITFFLLSLFPIILITSYINHKYIKDGQKVPKLYVLKFFRRQLLKLRIAYKAPKNTAGRRMKIPNSFLDFLDRRDITFNKNTFSINYNHGCKFDMDYGTVIHPNTYSGPFKVVNFIFSIQFPNIEKYESNITVSNAYEHQDPANYDKDFYEKHLKIYLLKLQNKNKFEINTIIDSFDTDDFTIKKKEFSFINVWLSLDTNVSLWGKIYQVMNTFSSLYGIEKKVKYLPLNPYHMLQKTGWIIQIDGQIEKDTLEVLKNRVAVDLPNCKVKCKYNKSINITLLRIYQYNIE